MRWLFQNFAGRMDFVLKNPQYAAKAIWRQATFRDEAFLARVTNSSTAQIRGFLDEPIKDAKFALHLRNAESEFRKLAVTSADLYAKKVLLQYAAIRALKPGLIVETGIANGVSSAYLLLAIKKNGRGRLHSVGLGEPEFLPAGREAGWFAPKWLREPWQIHLGDAREILPGLLSRLGEIDVFIHDSLHTYEHMLWEFQTAHPFLRPGALLLADDALWNTAFRDFADTTGSRDAEIVRGVGILRKYPA